ncbi:unnamed protein product [Moneuplotes crassus]|uniref:Uncharacterized protein n=1 Tax=Euplotes crassus TaxID=5936 RepID=A0AAD1UQ25_EUPCR|nr:unnamed protein product [Moneuplotes crassus]
MSEQGVNGAKESSLHTFRHENKKARNKRKDKSVNSTFKSARKQCNNSQINMTYFPSLKLGTQSNNGGISLTNTSKGVDLNRYEPRSHANSPSNLSFTIGEDFGTIPILQRGIVQPKKTNRYKSKKKSDCRDPPLLSLMPEGVAPKLGELNYYSRLNKKEHEYKVQLLQNRIQKLKKEEEKANMKMLQTSERAEQYIKTRNKYYEDQKRLINHRLQVQQDTETKRKDIIKNNDKKKKSMQQLKKMMIEQSKQRKNQQRQEINEALQNKEKELEKEHLERKAASVAMVKESQISSLKKRMKKNNKYSLSLQNSYYKRYLDDEDQTERNKQKIKKLEAAESKLLDKLQSTMEKQMTMHKTLENLVKSGKPPENSPE